MDIKVIVQKYMWVANLLLIFGICYLSAGAVNSYVVNKYLEPQGQAQGSASNLQSAPQHAGYKPATSSIADRDLFRMGPAEPTVIFDQDTEGEEPYQETSLLLKLYGVYYHMALSPANMASIQIIQKKESGVYRTGDIIEVGEKVTIQEIKPRRIALLRENGNKEWLTLEEDKKKKGLGGEGKDPSNLSGLSRDELRDRLKARRKAHGLDDEGEPFKWIGPNHMQVSKTAIDDALKDLSKIITEARVVPNFEGEGDDRKTNGFKIFKIKSGSIFEKLGMQNGDVIRNINENALDTPEQALGLLQSLRSESNFQMDLERHNTPITFKYDVK